MSMPFDMDRGYYQRAYNVGARISSNSWGGDGLSYSDECLQTDTFVWNHPDFVAVFAAGNAGEDGYYSLSVPSNAKNVIAVGASKSSRQSFIEGGYLKGLKVLGDSEQEFSVGFASFGPEFKNFETFEAGLAIADPILACSALNNADDVRDRIVLVKRGTCYFEEKVRNAENAGALMVIVINSEESGVVNMASSQRGISVSIPAVSISKSDGQLLIDALVEKTVNLRAPIDVESDSFQSGLLAEFSSVGPALGT
jgi:hypothetical protein